MHAPLNVSDRQLYYINALEQCHARGFYKLMGGCNQAKKDLSMCLRKERVDRTTRNRDEAKLRTAKKKELFDAIDRENNFDRAIGGAAQASAGEAGKEA